MIDLSRTLPSELSVALTKLGFEDPSLTRIDGAGVSHDHFKIDHSEWILRAPKLSQLGLSAETQLAIQSAAFLRASPSLATPKLKAALPVSQSLPRGGLIVEHIAGRAPCGPADMPALARALVRVHALQAPPAASRAPILSHCNPFQPILAVARASIERYLPASGLSAKAQSTIEDRLAWLTDQANLTASSQHMRLTLSDTHPGNFIVRPNGKAVFVDLEKPAYSSPTIDLAHAVITVATGWDPGACMKLSSKDRQAFIDAWKDAAPEDLVTACEPLILPMRQAVWLRTISFFLKWRQESTMQGAWSAERLGDQVARHFRFHIDQSLTEQAILNAAEDWS